MNAPKRIFFLTTLAAAILLSGCIQEDPQVEILRKRLESTELEISELRKQQAQQTTNPSLSAGDVQKLKTEIAQLKEENASLKARLSKKQASLTQDELVVSLGEASKPMREKIASLYNIEQAYIVDDRINMPNPTESPYSCTIRLKLLNLATQAREQVDIDATADATGQWTFPPLGDIAANIVPEGGLAVRPAPPQQQTPAPMSRPTANSQPPAHTVSPSSNPPPTQQPTARSAPSRDYGPGEVVGGTRLNWGTEAR